MGCPHDCVFCNQKRIAGTVSAPSTDEIAQQVEAALSRRHSQPPQVAFYGGSFTGIPEHEQNAYLCAVQDYIRDGRISGVRVSTRPDFIDENILDRLKSYHVQTVELGIQSFDDAVLLASGRGHTAEQARSAARCVKESHLELIIQLMAGLPGDSRSLCSMSASTAAQLEPDGVRIYPVAVIGDTALADMYSCGKYTPLDIESAVDVSADMLEIFIKHDIPVIRIGLNPSDELEGSVLAGAYHPALGELVRSRVYLRRARKALDELDIRPGASATLKVTAKAVPLVYGQHSLNRKILTQEYSLSSLRVLPGDIPQWQIQASIDS